MSRAGARAAARPRNERHALSHFLRNRVAAHGAALLVSAALVVAAHSRSDLLAGGADADVGLPADSTCRRTRGFFARAGGVFIGAVLLWDILFRGQLGFSISFLEEMYARNLGNIMMSPLRPVEFVAALMIMSIVRLSIGMVPVSLLAIAFFGFNLWALGFALAAFFVNLILTSWAIGIFVAGLLLRNGLGAESLAWTIMFLFLPLTCVYYPVAVLPHWLQYVAWALPPTYVFEGMRALLIDHVFRADLMVEAFGVQCRAVRGCIIRLSAASAERAGAGLAAADRRISQKILLLSGLMRVAAL